MATDSTDQPEIMARIGARLLQIRVEAGLSRAAAAWQIGVSEQAYANRENGMTEIKVHEIVILSDLFGVRPYAIFDAAAPVGEFPDCAPVGDEGRLADEAEELLRLFNRIADPDIRHAVAEAVRALARAHEDAG